jgi:hypothetical protein
MFRPYVYLFGLTKDKGNQFGEYELLNELPMCNEVLTVLPTLLITVAKDDVKELSAEEQQMLRNNTEMMRTNEEVMMVYLENLYWKRFKHSMVDNVISDKLEKKKKTEEPEIPPYHHSEHFSTFMMHNGCYVFSGAGLRFPEIMDENPKNPYDVEKEKKQVAFGKAYKPAKTLVDDAKKKALAKLGHKEGLPSRPTFK